jgi:surface antigen
MMNKLIKTLLPGSIFLLCSLYAVSANAVGAWTWATESAMSNFNEKDFELLREAGLAALENQDDQTEVEWNNPDTGNFGSVTTLGTRQIDNQTCRDTLLKNNTRTIQGTVRYLLCRQPDGTWVITFPQE